MKKLIAILLTVMICACAFSGCAKKNSTDTKDGDTTNTSDISKSDDKKEDNKQDTDEKKTDESDVSIPENTVETEVQVPGNKKELTGKMFIWEEASFEFTEITTDMGEWASQLKSPNGKWVRVIFNIKDSKIEVKRLNELITSDNNIRLDDYSPVTYSERGIAIEGDKAYAVGEIDVFFDVDATLELEKTNLYVIEQIEAAQDTSAGNVEASTGPIHITLASGNEVILTPISGGAFAEQEDNVIVNTRIGDTVHNSGSQFWAGSALRLSSMRDTKQYVMPKAVFTYESAMDSEAVIDAIGEIGGTAALILDGNNYPVNVAWITENMACFIFDCGGTIADIPAFGIKDGSLQIIG